MIMREAKAGGIIKTMDLQPHLEGGYFRRTYQADHRDPLKTSNGPRHLMTSIYYLLDQQSPVGQFHFNRSDILHYFHLGDAIEYSLIHADGSLQTLVMGSGRTTFAITRTGWNMESFAVARRRKRIWADQRSRFSRI